MDRPDGETMMRAQRPRVTPSTGTRRKTGPGCPGRAAVVVLAALAIDAAAQSFVLRRAVVASGGGASADPAGTVRISGTFAEPVTGGVALSSTGGAFVATGGFWADARAPRDRFFIDQFESAPAMPARRGE
jgi:hypothetical protein